MEYTNLGRTGLRASRMGLGCGGHSRVGMATSKTEAESVHVIQIALEMGMNFIDTAESYRTEEIVGLGLMGSPRDQVILSTKASVAASDEERSTAAEFRVRVENGLRRLKTDYIDVFHIHGVLAEEYDYAVSELVPVLEDLRSEGKIRFLGITEAFSPDPAHQMLIMAAQHDCWDVVMVGFNILNQTARDRVLPWTQAKNVGTLGMFAVRRALSHPEMLPGIVQRLVAEGSIEGSLFDLDDPLGFLVVDGVARTITEAAYRFCLHEPGIDLVLSGTGDVEHLRLNAESLSLPPLPEEVCSRLRAMFAGVDSVVGN